MSPTLMAIREKQLMRLSLRKPPEKQGLAHNGCSESAYTGLHPDFHLDGYSSGSTAYTGFHLNDYSSVSLLKDKDSPTMVSQSQPRQVLTLMATRASQLPIRVFTQMATRVSQQPI